MEYYKLIYDYEGDSQAGLIIINEENLGFNRYDVNLDIKLDIQKIYCTIEEENISNYDYIANNLAWLIVSEKVKDIMEECNIGMCEFIPVVDKENKNVIGYLVQCLNVLYALDEKKSLCRKTRYTSNGKEYERISVIKYAVDSEKLGDIDMFKLRESDIPYFVSQKLKDNIQNNKANGFDFMKIKVS